MCNAHIYLIWVCVVYTYISFMTCQYTHMSPNIRIPHTYVSPNAYVLYGPHIGVIHMCVVHVWCVAFLMIYIMFDDI